MLSNRAGKGDMTVREAGEKGGKKTAKTHSRTHYEEIGKKGGERVSQLIDKGRRLEENEKHN